VLKPFTAVLGATLAAALTVAVLQWRRADHVSGELAQRNLVAATAADVGQALFTYDYQDLGAAQRRILTLTSGSFAQQQRASGASVESSLVKARAVGTATVSEVSVTGVAGGGAGAFVLVDTRAQGSDGVVTGVEYLAMGLVLDRGRWTVDSVLRLQPPSPSVRAPG
jgi:hypothetical protein